MYPGGIPLQKEQIIFSGRSVEQIWRTYLDSVVEKKQPEIEDEQYLRYYVLYHIHAPIFSSDFTQELLDRVNTDMSLDDLISVCMEYGLDPL